MKVEINSKDESPCVVRVGSMGRSDPDTEIQIVKKVGDDWERVERTFVNGKKLLKFDLDEGEYHVMVVGDKTAGVATTAGNTVPFPFDVFLDPPADHAKDFMRLDIPANKPVAPDLARSIKAALK